MIEDEVIKEVWQVRDELAARFNYDLDAMVAHYQQMQRERGIPIVSLPPRKPEVMPAPKLAGEQNGNGEKPKPQFGRAKGMVSLSGDFAEPLAEYEEYTQ